MEEVLSHEQREDDEHGVNLRRVAHDLRVQDVRLELVDADDPHQHETAVPSDCVSPSATAGMALAIEPKIGMSEKTVATSARTGQYLSPTKAKPTALSAPLMRLIVSCPRTTPDRPAVHAREEMGEVGPRRGPHEQREEADDLVPREHQVGGEHQRDAEDEDRAAHLRHDGSADHRDLERVRLRVREALEGELGERACSRRSARASTRVVGAIS